MILGFMQKFPDGRPTNFREKIQSCVEPVVNHTLTYAKVFYLESIKPMVSERQLFFTEITESAYIGKEKIEEIVIPVTFKPKRHTIRQDKHNRWKTGRSIQMVYRGPKYSIADHFNKGIPELEECKAVQRITIRYRRPSWLQKDYGDAIPPFTLKVKNQFLYVYIDDKLIGHKTLKELAINDGFNSIEAFLRYFRKSINNWKLIFWDGSGY
jgi:hypothetical protein